MGVRLTVSTFFAITLCCVALPVQDAAPAQPSAAPVQESDKNAPELSAQDTPITFEVRVNLVEVRAVVRDAHGNAIGNLKQEDFQLFDNGKPQVITRFSVEESGARPPAIKAVKEEASPEAPGAASPLPKHYVAYLFDDIHLQFGDLTQVRSAAIRHFQNLQATDRAAVFTTSGQVQLDFTDDREKLKETLNRIRPTSIATTGATECPNISYYMADLIVNKNDNQALQVATQDALDCAFQGGPTVKSAEAAQMTQQAGQMAKTAARRQLQLGDHETHVSLATLRDVVRRISAMPGQRSILIVSPGFYNPDELWEQNVLAEQALHSYVTISALDARGLYNDMPDASTKRVPAPPFLQLVLQYQHDEAFANADVLSELANSTGGTFFHGNNDLDQGFKQLDSPPEHSYLLAFSPQDLKYDGRFHNVKVTVKGPQKFAIQARKGYYAPRQAVGEAEQAKQQIQDEVFSQEELHELPVEMHTQFFKTTDDEARLSVLVKLDVPRLHYRKANGRNNNNLTVVSALFDRNGNYVTGVQKVVQMHWKDETLSSKVASGVTVKTSFDVKPGSYVVRLVVRDDEGQLAAQNGAIEIP